MYKRRRKRSACDLRMAFRHPKREDSVYGPVWSYNIALDFDASGRRRSCNRPSESVYSGDAGQQYVRNICMVVVENSRSGRQIGPTRAHHY